MDMPPVVPQGPKDESQDDFDVFLADAVGREDLATEGELFYETLQAQMFEALPRYGIFSLTGPDEKTAQENFDMTVSSYLAVNEDQLRRDNEALFDFEGDLTDYVHDFALQAIKDEALKEAGILARVSIIMGIHEYVRRENPEQAALDLNEAKKKLIISLLVDGTISVHDEWYQFLTEFIPGEFLNPDAPEAAPYFATALEQYANSAEDRKVTHETMTTLTEVLEGTIQNSDGKEYEALRAANRFMLESLDPSEVQRAAHFDELRRKFGLEPGVYQKVIEILNASRTKDSE